MSTTKQTYVDKIYRLTSDAAPMSYILPTRNTARYPLLWFDAEKGYNRPLRYARNQPSPFEDEQDGNAIVEPIIFENGFLSVSKTNPVLQRFLEIHPLYGKAFTELNEEKNAQEQLKAFDIEVDALVKAKTLPIDVIESVARVLLGVDTSAMTSAEIRRDIFIFIKKDPSAFLAAVSDPNLDTQSTVQLFFDKRVLGFRNNNKEVWLNTPQSKRRLIIVAEDEDPIVAMMSYFKTEEGAEMYMMLEKIV